MQGAGALLGVQLHSIAAPALGQGAHGAAGKQLHLPAFQLPLQQVYQVGSLVGVRVDPAGLVCPGHKPQAMEPAQRVGCIHSLQQPLQCGGVCGKIPLRADGEVVQVAAAVARWPAAFFRAGGCARPPLPAQHRHRSGLPQGQRPVRRHRRPIQGSAAREITTVSLRYSLLKRSASFYQMGPVQRKGAAQDDFLP